MVRLEGYRRFKNGGRSVGFTKLPCYLCLWGSTTGGTEHSVQCAETQRQMGATVDHLIRQLFGKPH